MFSHCEGQSRSEEAHVIEEGLVFVGAVDTIET
jgi:hypothetical protein